MRRAIVGYGVTLGPTRGHIAPRSWVIKKVWKFVWKKLIKIIRALKFFSRSLLTQLLPAGAELVWSIPLYVKITLSKKLMKKSKGLLSSAQLNFSSVKHNSAQRKFCKSTTLPLFFSQVYQSLLPRFQVKIFPPIIFKSFHSSF